MSSDLHTCLRRGYYRVYGSWGGWNLNGSDEERALYLAKQSKSLYAYGGIIVHDAIKKVLQRHRAELPIADNDAIVARIEEKMKEEITYSMQLRWKKLRTPKKATLILLNHVTGEDLPIQDIRDAVERYKACMRAFLDDHLPSLLEMGPRRWVIIDSLDRIRYREFDLFMAPDLVVHDRVNWQVTDWKTGDMPNLTQVQIYGLYLQKSRKRDFDEDIKAEEIYVHSVPLLNTEGVASKQLTEEDLTKAMTQIDTDIDRLLELEPYGLNRDKSAFPRTEHTGNCSGCVYRHYCEEDPQ